MAQAAVLQLLLQEGVDLLDRSNDSWCTAALILEPIGIPSLTTTHGTQD